jgi:transcriptional regulator with XRE-family HTH domain
MNPLDYDPTYPRNPVTLAQYIRKYRKDKGLSGRELAERIGVAKFTVVKWEGGRMPRFQKQITALREGIPGVGRFLP